MDGKDEDDEIIALESSRFRFCLSEEAIRPSTVAVVGPDYRIKIREKHSSLPPAALPPEVDLRSSSVVLSVCFFC